MRVTFLAPQLPPAACGVADHTLRLAQVMRKEGVESSFIYRRGVVDEQLLPGPVNEWSGGPRRLEQCVAAQNPDWLWVQLSGYGYSRWGAPFRLAQALRRIRRRMPSIRMVVYLHETHCLPPQLGAKGRLLSPWQRHNAGKVARLGDLIFAAVPLYRRRAVAEYGVQPDKVYPLPLGPNIPPVDLTLEERAQLRIELGWKNADIVVAVFGLYATQLRALERFEMILLRGLNEGHIHRIVCIGGDPNQSAPPQLTDWGRRVPHPDCFELLGPRPCEHVARILSCCDFGLLAEPRIMTEKSSVYVSYAHAALAVLAQRSPLYPDTEDDGLPVLESETWDWGQALSPRVVDMRASLQKFAKSRYDWNVIACNALKAMKKHSVARD
jgi:hypothetical protein